MRMRIEIWKFDTRKWVLDPQMGNCGLGVPRLYFTYE